LCRHTGGRTNAHEQFGTSVIVLPDGEHVDVVTARRESYAYPGALPDVASGSLRADLFRRDFTINALAISLMPDDFGRLIDYFGGMRDIQNRTIRILHGLSFVDDPTRMLRAMRFASRLNFQLSEGTRQMLIKAVEKNMLKRVSGKRIQTELVHILRNPRPINTLQLLDKYGLLRNIHRKIKFDRFTLELLQSLGETISWFRLTFPDEPFQVYLVYYMALFDKLTYAERRSLCRRLVLPARDTDALLKYKKRVKAAVYALRKSPDAPPSEITHLFGQSTLETIMYTHAFANTRPLKKAAADYLTTYRHVRLAIGGEDLQQMGLQEGPIFSRILSGVRDAVLDGEISGRKAQMKLARSLAGQITGDNDNED
jgi:tRNA nucleotidyltransferase (CCA-adding enzyme)